MILESLDIVSAEATRLERLVGDVLDLAKLRAHRFTVQAEEVDMLEIVHARPPEPPVVEDESARLDEVDRHPEAGREAQDRAGILRDVGLIGGEAQHG